MSAKDLLDRISIPSPCSSDWNSMAGNDQVRFCEHCSLSVHNLSEMTRANAVRLVARSRGRLCVRYYQTPAQQILTRAPERSALYNIGSRVSRFAAGAFSATLSLSSVVAEPSSVTRAEVILTQGSARAGAPTAGGTLEGTVADPNGAVIAGATVMLSSAQTGLSVQVSTGDMGIYRFESLVAGSYTLRFEAPGFASREITDIYVGDTGEVQVNTTLEVGSVTEVVGALVIVAPANPFVKAAHDDDLEAVQALIAGVDVNLRDPESDTTALEHAVQNANREMVQLLLSHGAKVNVANEAGRSPLMQIGHEATCELIWDLIGADAKVNHADESGQTALIAAAYGNNSDIVKALLEAGADVNAKAEDGTTALMAAASEGRVNNVRALLLAGADLDARDEDGKNALMHAIEGEHRAVIRLLRSRGALELVLADDDE